MSDFRPALHPLEVGGVVYEVLFSLAQLDDICTQYGTFDAFLNCLGARRESKTNESQIARAAVFLVASMVNDAVREGRAQGGQVTAEQIMRRVSAKHLGGLQSALVDMMANDLPPPEDDPKNVNTTP